MRTHRRTFLKVLAAGAASAVAGLPTIDSLADVAGNNESEFFVFIIAQGAWDVTLWSDPRNELKGIIHPASTENTDTGPLKRWVDAPLEGGFKTFELIRPANSSLVFGPGAGDLVDMVDRITVINGLEMNTVAHPDGQLYSTTGRH